MSVVVVTIVVILASFSWQHKIAQDAIKDKCNRTVQQWTEAAGALEVIAEYSNALAVVDGNLDIDTTNLKAATAAAGSVKIPSGISASTTKLTALFWTNR